MLILLDMRDEAKRFDRELRASLVAAHPEMVERVFPEWFRDRDDEGDEVSQTKAQEMRPEEGLELLETLKSGSLSADDLDEGWV